MEIIRCRRRMRKGTEQASYQELSFTLDDQKGTMDEMLKLSVLYNQFYAGAEESDKSGRSC